MKKFYLMCGCAYAGKSTLARAIQSITEAHYISLDEINHRRGLGLVNEIVPLHEWEHTHQLAFEKISECGKSGRDIILDDTNYAKKLRIRFKALASQMGYESIVVFVDTSKAVLIDRRNSNKQTKTRMHVPSQPFYEVIDNFEIPLSDENTIVYHDGEDISEWLNKHIQ